MEKKSLEPRICRICLLSTEEENTVSVYTVSEIIMFCTSVKILECDGLPSNICSKCRNMAERAYEFRILCEKSDKELRQRLLRTNGSKENVELKMESVEETNHISNCDDKITLEPKYESDAENNIYRNDSEDPSSPKIERKVITKSFNCRFCNIAFFYKGSLIKHETEHTKPNSNKCPICGKMYSTHRRLLVHINIHNRKGSHLCQTCGKQFTLPENLLRHQRIHSGEKPYHCDICNKSFIQSGELKSHMITHTADKSYLCSFCGNKFARKLSLRVHIRRIHLNSSQVYTCGLCGRSFKDKRDLAQHNLIHSGERKHLCKECNKAFNRKSNLKVHELIHSGYRPHVCPVCQKGFIQKHALNTHIEKTHQS